MNTALTILITLIYGFVAFHTLHLAGLKHDRSATAGFARAAFLVFMVVMLPVIFYLAEMPDPKSVLFHP